MVTAVIVGGGKGKRMNAGVNKQYIRLQGKEIIIWTLEKFNSCSCIDEIVLVLPEGEIDGFKDGILKKHPIEKLKFIAKGGSERQDSVYNGLKACSIDTDIVLIHDGARPFVSEDIIENIVESSRQYGAASAAVKVKDTIKLEDGNGMGEKNLDRSMLWAMQTPQGFKYSLIMDAHKACRERRVAVTDDTAMAELMGHKSKLVEGSYFNIKITTPEDLILGEAIAQKVFSKENK